MALRWRVSFSRLARPRREQQRWASSEETQQRLAFIPPGDRKNLIDLHFKDPAKYTPERLAAASGCPAPNIRGMLRLAYMERSLHDTMNKKMKWNVVKVPVDDSQTHVGGPGSNGGGEKGKKAPQAQMTVTDKAGRKSQFSRIEATDLLLGFPGKVTTFPEKVLSAAFAWEQELKTPYAKIQFSSSDAAAEVTQSFEGGIYGIYDPLKAETELDAVKKVSPTQYRAVMRARKAGQMQEDAHRVLQMTLDADYPLHRKSWSRDRAKVSYVFLDISDRKNPENSKVWVYDRALGKTRDATDEERERMILSRTKLRKASTI